jgi:DNA mismatch repair ATPase MutL
MNMFFSMTASVPRIQRLDETVINKIAAGEVSPLI